MCGIAGIWNRDGAPVERAALKRMADELRHRGPDGEGFHIAGELGLAHRRLKIIELSDSGAQPMGTEEGRFWITFNGEIHNFVELRGELEARGVSFRSHSDTEVALKAYATWGRACFEKFNGMWALAVWDAQQRELVLSRDRFGIKPLVYSERGGRFTFASEAKALLAVFPEELLLNKGELNEFLAGVFPVTGEQTFYANLFFLRAGHCMTVRADGMKIERWWRFQPGREEPRADAEEQVRAILTDAVRLRMRSDVPVSFALSGGIDSSAVTRLAAGFTEQQLNCFSLKYDEKGYDESAFSLAAADGSPRYVFNWVRPQPGHLLEGAAKIVRAHDSPTVARGRYAWWAIMEAVGRSGARVLLTGDGADEVFAGYNRFLLPYLIDRVRLGGSPSRRNVWQEYCDIGGNFGRKMPAWRQIFVGPMSHAMGLPVLRRMRVTRDAWVREAGSVDRRHYGDAWALRSTPRPFRSVLNNALWHEFTCAGFPEMIQAHDGLSMAHGVEARAPLLDHRLVEFAFTLPYHEKIRDGWTKSLLRRALRDVLPPVIRERRTKYGTPVPLRLWMSEPREFAAIRETLLDGALVKAGILDARKLELHLTGAELAFRSESRVEPIWRWLTAELWFRDYGVRAGG